MFQGTGRTHWMPLCLQIWCLRLLEIFGAKQGQHQSKALQEQTLFVFIFGKTDIEKYKWKLLVMRKSRYG